MISDFSFVAGCLFNCGMVDFFLFTVSCWCVVCVADTFTVLSIFYMASVVTLARGLSDHVSV